MNDNLPLNALVPPEISIASDKTLALETIVLPGFLTLPATKTSIYLGFRLESTDFLRIKSFWVLLLKILITSES